MPDKKTIYFIQQEGQARLIWDGRRRLVLISADPAGIFATNEKSVAEVLRHYNYKEMPAKQLLAMGYKLPAPDQIEYTGKNPNKYQQWDPEPLPAK